MPAEVCALTSRAVVIVAGGHPLGGLHPELPAGAFVIAADGGVDRALALGLHVDLAVGDFDSVTPAGLAAVRAAGARVERHPPTKDATDLELALDAALGARALPAPRDRVGRRPPRPPARVGAAPCRRALCGDGDRRLPRRRPATRHPRSTNGGRRAR